MIAVLLAALLLAAPALAGDIKPDDTVVFHISAEEWVSTDTARVTVQVEAAADGAKTATLRSDMKNAVMAMAKGEWRLTNFYRSQDSTGLERWNATYEARLPENILGGLFEKAKTASKPGMQLTVGEMDFTPTLDEVQNVQQKLRYQLAQKAAAQIVELNNALPGRQYRLSSLSFGEMGFASPMAMMKRGGPEMMTMAADAPDAAVGSSPSMATSQKIVMVANIVASALAPVTK
ncbi:MAG: hypothetical protein EBQ89_01950 [Alphaproteobacteria bacterium]|nr:hypothetical protein [Alphaproteobacteria bacterium]